MNNKQEKPKFNINKWKEAYDISNESLIAATKFVFFPVVVIPCTILGTSIGIVKKSISNILKK